jgi:hypothetical protein
MALVRGTNCGFVTVAPIGDPVENNCDIDFLSAAFKDVSPAGAAKVTEIGWWLDNATQESNFEVAIYDHNSGDNNPEAIVGVSRTNAKGTAGGVWKRVTGLNIAISAETTYWMAVQLDNTSAITYTNYLTGVGVSKRDLKVFSSTLPNPWGVTSSTLERLLSIYAVYETDGEEADYKFGNLVGEEVIDQNKGMFVEL